MKRECRCTSRKMNKHGCIDAVQLGLTPGTFNTLGAWPDDADEQRLVGAYAHVGANQFSIARVLLPRLVKEGWVERISPQKVRITDVGKELRVRIRNTNHWERTAR